MRWESSARLSLYKTRHRNNQELVRMNPKSRKPEEANGKAVNGGANGQSGLSQRPGESGFTSP